MLEPRGALAEPFSEFRFGTKCGCYPICHVEHGPVGANHVQSKQDSLCGLLLGRWNPKPIRSLFLYSCISDRQFFPDEFIHRSDHYEVQSRERIGWKRFHAHWSLEAVGSESHDSSALSASAEDEQAKSRLEAAFLLSSWIKNVFVLYPDMHSIKFPYARPSVVQLAKVSWVGNGIWELFFHGSFLGWINRESHSLWPQILLRFMADFRYYHYHSLLARNNSCLAIQYLARPANDDN
jgi:hypothetical protein